jgi:hypothetical protein
MYRNTLSCQNISAIKKGAPVWPEKKKSAPKNALFIDGPKSLAARVSNGPKWVRDTNTERISTKMLNELRIKGNFLGSIKQIAAIKVISANIPYTKKSTTLNTGMLERIMSGTLVPACVLAKLIEYGKIIK